MKAMYKYELARAAGVSTRTLSSFIEINKEQIEREFSYNDTPKSYHLES